MEVKAGTQECFYENVKAGETIDVEYQVRDRGNRGWIQSQETVTRHPVPLIVCH